MKRIAAALLLAAAPAVFADAGAPRPLPPGYAVASAHPLATQAGMEILAGGGNAFDAAVAVSAALAVVEPTGSGLGGGGFWLLHRERDGLQVFVDGRETAPLAATRDMYLDARGAADPKASRDGARAAGIPGEPAALVHIARKYGSRPLPELLAPAIRYAREGFPVDAKLAEAIARNVPRLSGAAPALLAPGGTPLAEGALLRQPELADTLARLAGQGREGLYAGDYAGRWIREVNAAGGVWSAEDFRRYAVKERRPVVFHYRDARIVTAPPPSAGGVALAQALQMLEVRAAPTVASAAGRHFVVEVLRRAFRDRARYLGDPDFVPVPLHRLLSREYASALARGIDARRASASAPPAGTGEGTDTTHFSVLDAAGNRVAGTLSINLPFGSGFMAPGTGIFLNDEMDDFAAAQDASNAYGLVGSAANAIEPGKRPLSSMSPTFVEGPRGLLIVGTPGGSRIVSMVLLAVLGFTDGGLDAAQLAALPRYHHQYLPDVIQFEPGAIPAAEQAVLRERGHALKELAAPYGNLQAVWWDVAAGRLEAAADPRGVGAAEVRMLREPAAAAAGG